MANPAGTLLEVLELDGKLLKLASLRLRGDRDVATGHSVANPKAFIAGIEVFQAIRHAGEALQHASEELLGAPLPMSNIWKRLVVHHCWLEYFCVMCQLLRLAEGEPPIPTIPRWCHEFSNSTQVSKVCGFDHRGGASKRGGLALCLATSSSLACLRCFNLEIQCHLMEVMMMQDDVLCTTTPSLTQLQELKGP